MRPTCGQPAKALRGIFPLAAALALIALPAPAEDAATAVEAPTAAAAPAAAESPLEAAARAYVASPGQQALIDALLSPEAVLAQINAAIPGLPPHLTALVSRIASEELAGLREKLETAMVVSAVETFSVDEIRALDAFYATPEGQSILVKMQPFLEGALVKVAPDIQAAQEVILQRTVDALRAGQ